MLATLLIKELEAEMATTQKMLKLVPADKLDWQPHPKSMSLAKLAGHVTEIGGWFSFCLEVEEVDFGLEPWVSPKAEDGEGFAKTALELTQNSLEALKGVSDDTLLNKRWVMKFHGQTIMDFSKYEALRHSMSQLIHHRAQLGVFLRLLDIPIPGSYGPSADEM
ncbi:DinB family protein [Marinilongibacter aquaticus]|uniref:DinB family protein n=1 Tax=Marinilongibacter aquaticus TaxID=2975157 RepID=UPI0021BD7357|nr:DinB family protein [Marinilongibacter aquaticus]UBM60573.1 DinB family protein [Marinilongibacter aquaticus]